MSITAAVKRRFDGYVAATWVLRLAFWLMLADGLFVAWCAHRVDGWQVAICAAVAASQFSLAAAIARTAHKERLPI
ncbi:hypothetical protein [Nocardia wallacei]|uniref:hypothetical protein n=1 Tax=Nocardia wallacei TaxID=480035 RepID=UPI002457D5EE|nr:hypothetical protein [Nocardia wallacei]